MPTSVSSKGYEGGKRKVRPKTPRNPTTEHEGRVPQPGVPRGPRDKAEGSTTVTVHDDGTVTATGPEATRAAAEAHRSQRRVKRDVAETRQSNRKARNAKVAKSLETPTEFKPESKAELRAKQTARRNVVKALGDSSLKPASKAIASAQAKGATSGDSFKPDPKQLEVERDVIQPLQEEGKLPKHKTLGQQISDQVASKVVEYGIPAGAGAADIKAAYEAAQVGIRGVQAADDVIGGVGVAGKLGVKPIEVADSSGVRAQIAQQKAEEAIAKDSGSGVVAKAKAAYRGRAGQAAKDAASGLKTDTSSAASRKAIRQGQKDLAHDLTGTRSPKQAVLSNNSPLALATKGGASQFLAPVQGHEKAAVENPLKVAETTAKSLPGFITVPIGIAANVGLTGGRAASTAAHEVGIPGAAGYSGKEILAPVKYEGQSQLAFAEQVGKILTSEDSKEVQEAVENEIGLMLPITAALGAKAGLDHLGKGDGSAAEAIADQVRSKVESVRASRGEGHGDGAKVFEKSHQRKDESVHAARTKRAIKAEAHDRSHEVVKHAREMSEKEELRLGTTRNAITKQRQPLVVRPADSVPFLLRHGISLDDPAEALKEVKRIGRKIKTERKAHNLPERVEEKGDLSTQDVIESLERNPDWLKKPALKDTLEAARGQEHHAVEHGLSPDHSEGARVSSVAVANDIPQAHERFPDNVKHLVRADEKAGQDSGEVLRKEAKQDYAKARAADKKADKKAGQAWRDSGRAKEAAAKQVKDGDPKLEQATVEAVNAHIANTPALHNEGPEYVNTGTPKTIPEIAGTTGAAPGELSKLGNSKHKTGFNDRVGHSKEGLGNYLDSSIGAPVAKRHIFANTRRFVDESKQTEHAVDSNEARKLFADPDTKFNSKNFVLMDTQLTNRAYKFINKDDDPRFDDIGSEDDEEFFTKLGKRSGLIADLNDAQKGRKYNVVPRAKAEEFMAQMSAARTNRVLASMNKWSNFLILNTSPAWALTQFGAEFAQAVIAEPRLLNPVKLKQYIHAYHAMDPIARREFETWADATTRSIGDSKDIAASLHTGKDAAGANKAFGVFNRTKAGRILRDMPTSLRAIDEKKGAYIRVLTALAKQDRDLNGHLNRFLKGAGNLYRTESDIAKQLAGKSKTEVAEFWASHPKGAERYGKYLDEVMGNWSALTQNERVASQLLIFYPFMRMSLKWTFYSFPKEHPIRAAMSDWLATNNSQELKKILGGEPGFFSELANAPLYSGEGKTPAEAAGFVIPLSRLSVAGNAATEAVGGSLSEENQGPPLAKVAESVAQPAIGAGITGAFGLNKFTGKQEAHSGKQLLEQAESLSPISRTAKKIFKSQGEQDSLDELFGKLRGSLPEQTLRTLLFPEMPEKVSLQKDLVQLSTALKTMEHSGSDAHDAIKNKYREEGRSGAEAATAEEKLWGEYDKGKATLERLYKKYAITQKAEAENEDYEGYEEERKYGGGGAGSGNPFSSALSKATASAKANPFSKALSETSVSTGPNPFSAALASKGGG